MLNNIVIMGRLTGEPELKSTENSQFCRFSIATSRPKKNGQKETETDFFNCISWNNLAKIVDLYYHKGDMIVLSGHLRNNKYEKDGKLHVSTEILVSEIHFANSKKSDEQDLHPEAEYTEANLPF